jgi:hypothetical protein
VNGSCPPCHQDSHVLCYTRYQIKWDTSFSLSNRVFPLTHFLFQGKLSVVHILIDTSTFFISSNDDAWAACRIFIHKDCCVLVHVVRIPNLFRGQTGVRTPLLSIKQTPIPRCPAMNSGSSSHLSWCRFSRPHLNVLSLRMMENGLGARQSLCEPTWHVIS